MERSIRPLTLNRKNTLFSGSHEAYLQNSRDLIARLKELITQYNLEDTVELKGSFCMGHCAEAGVCVKFQEEIYSLTMDTVDDFFAEKVAGK